MAIQLPPPTIGESPCGVVCRLVLFSCLNLSDRVGHRSPLLANECSFLAVTRRGRQMRNANSFAAAEPCPRLKKVAFCERSARTGFQIFLESRCFIFLSESKVGDEIPGNELGGVRRIAAVAVEKTFFEIVGGPDVLFGRVGFGS